MRATVLAIWLLDLAVVTSCTHLRGLAPRCHNVPSEAGSDIRLLNAKILGRSVNDAVVLLQPTDVRKVDPEYVHADIKGGRYYAATMVYPTTLAVEDVRTSINCVYGKYEIKDLVTAEGGVWRNEEERFAIGLNQDADGIHVMYITFQPRREVFEDMLKAGVFGPYSGPAREPSQ